MKGFRPNKPRAHGTVFAAIAKAFDQAGGMETSGDIIGRSINWCYVAADPDVERRKKATLSYEEARALSRAGATALAEDLSLLAGGQFLPPVLAATPTALHIELAAYAKESGEAVAEVIRRAADGDFDHHDAAVAIKEIDDAVRALMQVRAIAAAALDHGRAIA